MDVAALSFDHISGAERAFADARDRDPHAPWLSEVAFVEMHRKARIVMRGTVAGHYVDVEDDGRFEGRGTGTGVLAGAAIGFAFGPAGFFAGMVVGSAFGGDREPGDEPTLERGLAEEIRAEVPDKSSALVLFGPAEHADSMVEALEGSSGRLVRHTLTPDAARQLEAAVASAPAAAAST